MPSFEYHPAEIELQEKTGRRDLAQMLGRRVTDHVTDEAAKILSAVPFIVAGTVDEAGRPWASFLAGKPGFIRFNGRSLSVDSVPVSSDPLYANTAKKGDIGLLAIDLAARLRFRINGRGNRSTTGIEIEVDQCYRNCPQYIHGRPATFVEPNKAPGAARVSRCLTDNAVRIVGAADTFFIATHGSGRNGEDPNRGADVSHRGGNPGFVTIGGDGRQLSFPDYIGNFMFNTLGNISSFPHCGLLFVDFISGEAVQITGSASVDWDIGRATTLPGAQRIVDVTIDEVRTTADAIPILWGERDEARDLRRYRRVPPLRDGLVKMEGDEFVEGFRRVIVTRIVEETEDTRSFYLRPMRTPLERFSPGQYLRLRLPGAGGTIIRHYSLSSFDPDPEEYRICVRRSGSGERSGSDFMFQQVSEGAELLVSDPRGNFVPDTSHDRPIALISTGVGITPMMCILEALAHSGDNRPIVFIHGTRHSGDHIYKAEVRRLSDRIPNITAHFRYSQPRQRDVVGRDHDSAGRIDATLLKQLVPVHADTYLCGSPAFLEDARSALLAIGMPPGQIRLESFGSNSGALVARGKVGAAIEFAATGITGVWRETEESLLTLAESLGLDPPYSCRSGECGTCQARLLSGKVVSEDGSLASVEPGNILLCCSQPTEDLVIELPK